MKANVGRIDRILRVSLGAALLSLLFFDPSNWVGVVGIVPLVTGAVSFCPVYRLFGLSTCPAPAAPKIAPENKIAMSRGGLK